MDKDGEYVDHDQFPSQVLLTPTGTMGEVIDKLMERIENICDEMEDEYLDE